MTPNEFSDALEMAAVKAGTDFQLFYHDGWKFLVEADLERNGFHVKLEFLFFIEAVLSCPVCKNSVPKNPYMAYFLANQV
jgi:hypothetical protein